MKQHILLLDGNTVQTISVARALKCAGYYITAFISQRISYGYVCRYIDKKIKAPDTSLTDRYIDFLAQFLTKNDVDVIIPMYDDSATLLSKNKVNIETNYHVHCAIPDYATYSIAHDKQKLMELCQQNNFPHPKTYPLTQENIQIAVSHVGLPAMIKPNISAGAKGIVLANTIEEIRLKLPYATQQYGACSLQHYINHSGIYYNVMLYRSSHGNIIGYTVLKIMRYFPLKGGTSCYCETIKNEQLVQTCAKVLDKLEWIGFADFDVMEEKGTKKLYIIEINPRLPASIHGAYISGVNFPEIIVKDALRQPITEPHYQPGKVLRFMGLDIMWFCFAPQRLRFKPSWFHFFGKNIYYQDGSLSDPLPMIMGCISGIIKYLSPSFRKSKLRQ